MTICLTDRNVTLHLRTFVSKSHKSEWEGERTDNDAIVFLFLDSSKYMVTGRRGQRTCLQVLDLLANLPKPGRDSAASLAC